MPEPVLQGKGIAITRPLDQANKLSEMIGQAGGHAISFPLIAIAPLEDYSAFEQQLLHLADYDLAIFISSNAVQNAMPRVIKHGIPEHLQFSAIGPVTAQELQAFGVKQVLTPHDRFDSESLLALPQMQQMHGKRIVIFRGVGGREVLADTLKSRGALVDFAECYQRINPQQNADVLRTLWQNKELDAVVVTSSEAMRHLLQMTDNGQAEWIRKTYLCVNHARIAEEPHKIGLQVAVAKAPGDVAMLECLIETLR